MATAPSDWETIFRPIYSTAVPIRTASSSWTRNAALHKMSAHMHKWMLAALCSLGCSAQDFRVYAIDVEGGKSTLYVSPSGESMLVDAGYAGHNGRDAGRIAAAAADAGVKEI